MNGSGSSLPNEKWLVMLIESVRVSLSEPLIIDRIRREIIYVERYSYLRVQLQIKGLLRPVVVMMDVKFLFRFLLLRPQLPHQV